MSQENFDLFVPIQRTVESNGDLYTYGVLPFDEPDSFDTVLTRELVEANQERLRKYPTLRFMHKDPVGTIVFDRGVTDPLSGQMLQTQIVDAGFAVLGKIDPACTKERSLIQNGHFGYSYGFMPKGVQPMKQCKDGKVRTHFTTGDLYEFSVVDTPSNWTADVKSFVRIDSHDGGIERELTAEERDKLSDSDFALVIEEDGKKIRKLPIHDKAHAVAAAQALSGARGGVDIPESKMAHVKSKVHAALVKFGVDPQNYKIFKEEKRQMDEKDLAAIKALIDGSVNGSEQRILAKVNPVQSTDNKELTELKTTVNQLIERMNGLASNTEILKKTIEAIPAEHSPTGQQATQTRAVSIGVRAMLEAATKGGTQ